MVITYGLCIITHFTVTALNFVYISPISPNNNATLTFSFLQYLWSVSWKHIFRNFSIASFSHRWCLFDSSPAVSVGRLSPCDMHFLQVDKKADAISKQTRGFYQFSYLFTLNIKTWYFIKCTLVMFLSHLTSVFFQPFNFERISTGTFVSTFLFSIITFLFAHKVSLCLCLRIIIHLPPVSIVVSFRLKTLFKVS